MTARQCFGNAFNAEINERKNAELKRTNAPTTDNLVVYNRIRDEMFEAVDEDARTRYEEEAKAFNTKIRSPPDESEIYK